MNAASFARSYSDEVGKFYKGSLSRRDIENFKHSLSGQISLGLMAYGSGGGAKAQKEHGFDKLLEGTSSKDTVNSMVYSIATNSNLTDRQKESALRTLSNTLIENNDVSQPKDLPDAARVQHKGRNPDGEIVTPETADRQDKEGN